MKKNHWNLILDLAQKAPKSGLYIFAIRDDNHIEYDFRQLQEGDALYCGEEKDPTAWFVPIAYHFCNEYKNKFELLELRKIVTEDSWRPCDFDDSTPGLRLAVFSKDNKYAYCLGDGICLSDNSSFLVIDKWLYSDDDFWREQYNDIVEIEPIAYHYVDLFGEEGHSYWWRTYNELHNKE